MHAALHAIAALALTRHSADNARGRGTLAAGLSADYSRGGVASWTNRSGGANQTVWVYNRVGKAGSESMLKLLGQVCAVHEVKRIGLTGFDKEASLRAAIDVAVVRMRSLVVSRPCRVIYGHFRWVDLPQELGVRYFTVIREPVARWRSLHEYYTSNKWCTSDAWCKLNYGRKTVPNATSCILEHERLPLIKEGIPTLRGYPNSTDTAARSCVSARDAMMADYFFSAGDEQSQCDVGLLKHRYAFVGTLEHSAEDIHRLLRLLGVCTPHADTASLVHKNRTPNTTAFVAETELDVNLNGAADAVLRRELTCDGAIYAEAVRQWGSPPATATPV